MMKENPFSYYIYPYDLLSHLLEGRPKPTVGIILGSGLGRLGDAITDAVSIPIKRGNERNATIGHQGNLIFGTLGGKQVAAMQGRFHYYEGYSMEEVTLPIRIMKMLGVNTLLVSNAAGALNPDYRVGDLMIITDHINFMPNPLIGPNVASQGTRFPDMTDVYSRRLRNIALDYAAANGITLRQGVYVAETGPCYETPAEYRMYRLLGGDAVGMSTVPEVIVAHHCGMEVFGMSVITNQSNNLDPDHPNDGADVVKQADLASDKMNALFTHIIENI